MPLRMPRFILTMDDARLVFQHIAREINPPWSSYTPAWTGATANPAIGNGTITGRYLLNQRMCFVNIEVVMGSTTTFGTGSWFFSTPPKPDNSGDALAHVDDVPCCGSAKLTDTGTLDCVGTSVIDAAASRIYVVGTSHAATGIVAAAVPFTWASTDRLVLSLAFPVR